ncbi:adenylate kinase [Streptomyces sp. NPDC007945]|uniref:adenylate kinase n=1 Tax=Streptomyces sp. NPDC007945 TaxID=3364797 RepID=UPI0036E8FB95
MRKVAFFGPPASGKTTLAGKLAAHMGVAHTDLDEILFTDTGALPLDEFRAAAAEITDRGSWVVEGNFSKLADVVWHRADVLVWLDLPLRLVVADHGPQPAAARRARRERAGEAVDLEPGLLRSAVPAAHRRAQIPAQPAPLRPADRGDGRPGLDVVRLRSGREADAWLADQLGQR